MSVSTQFIGKSVVLHLLVFKSNEQLNRAEIVAMMASNGEIEKDDKNRSSKFESVNSKRISYLGCNNNNNNNNVSPRVGHLLGRKAEISSRLKRNSIPILLRIALLNKA
jgi:hypothetical protein